MSDESLPEDQLDRRLMERVRGGDVAAFEELYRRYAGPLMSFFYRMCYDRIAAEDFLQETFMRVWRARVRYRPRGRVSTWIYQIAKNFWLNEAAKRNLRPFHRPAALTGDRAGELGQAATPGDRDAPDRAAERVEEEALLRAAVEQLSDKLRLAFVMARFQDLPYARIAEVLEIPLGTVKSRVALAEKTLRERLTSHRAGAEEAKG